MLHFENEFAADIIKSGDRGRRAMFWRGPDGHGGYIENIHNKRYFLNLFKTLIFWGSKSAHISKKGNYADFFAITVGKIFRILKKR